MRAVLGIISMWNTITDCSGFPRFANDALASLAITRDYRQYLASRHTAAKNLTFCPFAKTVLALMLHLCH